MPCCLSCCHLASQTDLTPFWRVLAFLVLAVENQKS